MFLILSPQPVSHVCVCVCGCVHHSFIGQTCATETHWSCGILSLSNLLMATALYVVFIGRAGVRRLSGGPATGHTHQVSEIDKNGLTLPACRLSRCSSEKYEFNFMADDSWYSAKPKVGP